MRLLLTFLLLVSLRDLSAMGISPLVRDSSACDVLVMKDGTEVSINLVLIDSKSIQYKPCGNPDGPLYVIPHKGVFMVKYANGERDVFPLLKDLSEARSQPKTGLMEGFGVASFFFSLGALLMPTNLLGVAAIFTLFGFMFATISLKRIENSNGRLKHRAWAIIGLLLSLIAAIIIFIIATK